MFHSHPSDVTTATSSAHQMNDVIAICREINSTIISTEKNPGVARMIMHKLFKNNHIDLCSILPPPYAQQYQESPYYQVHTLISATSVFFETILEDDQLCSELWDCILYQCEVSMAPPEPAKDSILFTVLSQYVTRILPCDENVAPASSIRVAHTPKTTQQTIRTPLQLFRANSPLVNRISIEERSHQMMSSPNVSFQPRLVQNFCNFVAKACTTAQFTNTNKLLLIRYLLKQFHVFCQFSTGDPDVDAWKLDLMADAPFKWQLFEFFKSCVSQVPSTTVFKDITMCWLTYCRPWRYHNMSDPTDLSSATKYRSFFERNVEFYEVILGKLIKRFAAFEMCEELIGTMRAIVEFAWKEPQTLLLRHVALDIQPHVHELLQQMQKVVRMHRAAIRKEQEENSGFWNSLFSGGPSQKTVSSRKLIADLLSLMKDSDSYIGTHLMHEMEENASMDDANHTKIQNGGLCTSLLQETPKSALGIPDFYIEPHSNHMLLTPSGKQQVINREKRFDYSKCTKDDAKAPARSHEIGIAVRLLTAVAQKLNEIPLVEQFGKKYSDNGLTGALARRLMYPPVPNLDPNATVPAYSARIYRTPPILRLRYFASYQSLFFTIWLLFAIKYGFTFTLVSLILFGLFVTVLIFANIEANTATQW
uniref:Uncharacterized protein n=1 Tax=Caenorhabditis japonica TaxID=281687 RepID=A0A8R1DFF4_CAEJA